MIHAIHPEALAELDEASTWYEREEPGLGVALVLDYRERLTFALNAPSAGALAGKTRDGGEIRRYRLQQFRRYAILLASIRGVPTVLAFEHSSRRPGYWHDRLG
ncbi:MAG: hypothetical protein KF901_26500 [Myxococcales bacterium]|nr:hypothetical protein [Myxococcales bacterium]